MTPCRDPALERLDWFDGARLLGADLRDAIAYDERLLGLHVRGPHDTWGVAEGLGLALAADRRRVTVAAGWAFDCRGAVLRLGAATDLALERAPAGAALDVVLGASGVRWEAAPAAVTAFGPGVRLGADVPLGRFGRSSGGLADPDLRVRRSLRALARPHLRTGITASGELAWSSVNGGLTALVDTSRAEFATTPRYVAALVAAPSLGAGVIGPFLSIASPGPGGFRARLTVAAVPPRNMGPLLDHILPRVAAVRIAWIGWERLSGCGR